jgi:hypothetical protein
MSFDTASATSGRSVSSSELTKAGHPRAFALPGIETPNLKKLRAIVLLALGAYAAALMSPVGHVRTVEAAGRFTHFPVSILAVRETIVGPTR